MAGRCAVAVWQEGGQQVSPVCLLGSGHNGLAVMGGSLHCGSQHAQPNLYVAFTAQFLMFTNVSIE